MVSLQEVDDMSFPPMPDEVRQKVIRRGCDAASPSNKYQLHHAIVSRKMVQGMGKESQALIHDERNLLVLPAEWNTSHANIPSTLEAIRMLHKHYRLRDIEEFYDSIPFKKKPFKFPKMKDLYPRTEIAEYLNS